MALTAFSIVAGMSLATQAMVSQVPGVRWVFYRNTLLAFQLKVPAAWHIRPGQKAVAFSSPAKGELHGAIGVLRSTESKGTIEEAAQKEFDLEGQPAYWQRSYASVGGMRALKIIKPMTDRPNTKVVEYYVEGPQGIYILQCLGPRNRWSLYAPLFAAMIKTFHFIS